MSHNTSLGNTRYCVILISHYCSVHLHHVYKKRNACCIGKNIGYGAPKRFFSIRDDHSILFIQIWHLLGRPPEKRPVGGLLALSEVVHHCNGKARSIASAVFKPRVLDAQCAGEEVSCQYKIPTITNKGYILRISY